MCEINRVSLELTRVRLMHSRRCDGLKGWYTDGPVYWLIYYLFRITWTQLRCTHHLLPRRRWTRDCPGTFTSTLWRTSTRPPSVHFARRSWLAWNDRASYVIVRINSFLPPPFSPLQQQGYKGVGSGEGGWFTLLRRLHIYVMSLHYCTFTFFV